MLNDRSLTSADLFISRASLSSQVDGTAESAAVYASRSNVPAGRKELSHTSRPLRGDEEPDFCKKKTSPVKVGLPEATKRRLLQVWSIESSPRQKAVETDGPAGGSAPGLLKKLPGSLSAL